jgi:hypothetical protein
MTAKPFDHPDYFRMNACLKKALGKPLTPEELQVVREVNHIQGWDRDSDTRPKDGDAKQGSARE